MKILSESSIQKIKQGLDEGEMLAQVVLDSIDYSPFRALAEDSLRKIREARESL